MKYTHKRLEMKRHDESSRSSFTRGDVVRGHIRWAVHISCFGHHFLQRDTLQRWRECMVIICIYKVHGAPWYPVGAKGSVI